MPVLIEYPFQSETADKFFINFFIECREEVFPSTDFAEQFIELSCQFSETCKEPSYDYGVSLIHNVLSMQGVFLSIYLLATVHDVTKRQIATCPISCHSKLISCRNHPTNMI